MTNCANDWSPVITMLVIQIPLIIGGILAWVQSRIQTEKIKSAISNTQAQVETVKTVVTDGFKTTKAKSEDNQKL